MIVSNESGGGGDRGNGCGGDPRISVQRRGRWWCHASHGKQGWHNTSPPSPTLYNNTDIPTTLEVTTIITVNIAVLIYTIPTIIKIETTFRFTTVIRKILSERRLQ